MLRTPVVEFITLSFGQSLPPLIYQGRWFTDGICRSLGGSSRVRLNARAGLLMVVRELETVLSAEVALFVTV